VNVVVPLSLLEEVREEAMSMAKHDKSAPTTKGVLKYLSRALKVVQSRRDQQCK
jgi:hypothetical protein